MQPSYSAKSDGNGAPNASPSMAILKEVMTNETSVLMDSDAANKAIDADAAGCRRAASTGRKGNPGPRLHLHA
jgi:hypothetical protein